MKSNMISSKMLLFAVALTLLAVTVQSWSDGNLSSDELKQLYNSPVKTAEWMVRPLGSSPIIFRIFSHTGVRVTLESDLSQWLIHKGRRYGVASNTVVTSARHMASNWKRLVTKNFNGRKKVADFVKRGGKSYNFLFDNCHEASIRMILQ
uniref:Uncharacterized protein n=1 Tax=Sander lucioperca TaxID=283035 RepID=A0A8D0CQV3_SANLU